MTVDKAVQNGINSSRQIADSKVAQLEARRLAPNGQESAKRVERAAILNNNPVRLSNASRELSAALGVSTMSDDFDQDKIDSIRREILEGRFPIDEDRLVKKFLELEKILGDLGNQA